jgi:hypothetical protein
MSTSNVMDNSNTQMNGNGGSNGGGNGSSGKKEKGDTLWTKIQEIIGRDT